MRSMNSSSAELGCLSLKQKYKPHARVVQGKGDEIMVEDEREKVERTYTAGVNNLKTLEGLLDTCERCTCSSCSKAMPAIPTARELSQITKKLLEEKGMLKFQSYRDMIILLQCSVALLCVCTESLHQAATDINQLTTTAMSILNAVQPLAEKETLNINVN
jgi:hypothetical protein